MYICSQTDSVCKNIVCNYITVSLASVSHKTTIIFNVLLQCYCNFVRAMVLDLLHYVTHAGVPRFYFYDYASVQIGTPLHLKLVIIIIMVTFVIQ